MIAEYIDVLAISLDFFNATQIDPKRETTILNKVAIIKIGIWQYAPLNDSPVISKLKTNGIIAINNRQMVLNNFIDVLIIFVKYDEESLSLIDIEADSVQVILNTENNVTIIPENLFDAE